MEEKDKNTADDVMAEEYLTEEELQMVVKSLQSLKNKKIYAKEFVGNDDKLVHYLYIPMSLDSSLHNLKIEYGSLRVKEFIATKITRLGISLADAGSVVTDFQDSDIIYKG